MEGKEVYPAASEVDGIGNRSLPSFWSDMPEAWFSIADGYFALKRITSEETRYQHLLFCFTQAQYREYEEYIKAAPPDRRYSATRERIVAHNRPTKAQKLQQIIRREEIGDDSPSKFLRRLLSLAEDTVDSQTIVEIWSSRLPKEVNAVIQAMLPEEDVKKLASLADRVYNAIYQSAAAIQAVEKQAYQAPTSSLEERISRLERLLENHYIREERSRDFHRHRSQSRDSHRHRSQSRSQSKNGRQYDRPKLIDGKCFYHRKFGSKARNCMDGCKEGNDQSKN
jgi:hypothetical protein